jgi:hypothetical protein
LSYVLVNFDNFFFQRSHGFYHFGKFLRGGTADFIQMSRLDFIPKAFP